MKFEHTEVWGFEHAIRGMRNPKDSWHLSDSYWDETFKPAKYIIGPHDLKLMQTLIHGGPEHRKFMRQIFVSVDITAPLYWWKEFDTYKVGTTANSTSTMHTITSSSISLDKFEIDDYCPQLSLIDDMNLSTRIDCLLNDLEQLRQLYLTTNDKKYWKELIRWLPEGWMQKRTITMNYENIYNMIIQRINHKQNEWSGRDNPELINFISWTKKLPYANVLFNYKDSNSVFDNIIIALCGESGAGKTAIAEMLAKRYNLKILNSYTTRAPRYENEQGHIFVSNDEFDCLTDLVAYTEFDNCRYCATSAQVDEANIYVIDPDGIIALKDLYKGHKVIVPIYIKADATERAYRMELRGDSEEMINNRLEHDVVKFAIAPAVCEVMFTNHNGKINECVYNIYNYIKNNYSEGI